MATDAATLLHTIYTAWREQRLADVMASLDDNFRFVVHVPADLIPGGDKPRSKAETLEFFQYLIDTFDFLSFDQGPIIATGDRATVQPHIRYRHKQTGKVLETKFSHVWNIKDGKAIDLEERHDTAKIRAFLRSVAEDGA
jgi:ketosteroid isomerase-like protein